MQAIQGLENLYILGDYFKMKVENRLVVCSLKVLFKKCQRDCCRAGIKYSLFKFKPKRLWWGVDQMYKTCKENQ